MCELRSEELFEGRSSQLYTQLLICGCEKKARKKFKLVRDSFSCHLKLKRAHGFSDSPAKFQKKGIVKRVCCITCQEIMTGINDEQVV